MNPTWQIPDRLSHAKTSSLGFADLSFSLQKHHTNKINSTKSFTLSLSEPMRNPQEQQWWYSAAFMATTSYSGIGRYNCKLLPLSLCSITSCPCHSSPSKALVPARPRVVKLNCVFDGRRSLLRLGRDGGLARRRVITAVARVEPEQLGEENANQVLSI